MGVRFPPSAPVIATISQNSSVRIAVSRTAGPSRGKFAPCPPQALRVFSSEGKPTGNRYNGNDNGPAASSSRRPCAEHRPLADMYGENKINARGRRRRRIYRRRRRGIITGRWIGVISSLPVVTSVSLVPPPLVAAPVPVSTVISIRESRGEN